MFGPWIEIYVWLKGLLPTLPRREGWKGWKGFRFPRFQFIMWHYTYLISLTIIGSIILYPGGNLDYIDALFFGSGCATQSGLNTINLNDLHLYQQITLMLLTMFATPIFINTCVVFIRLYWFEKRFQNVVLEAQRYRRTRERSRTITHPKDELDQEAEIQGVGDRKIVVMHPGDRTTSVAKLHHDSIVQKPKDDASSETSSGNRQDERESSSTDYAQDEDQNAAEDHEHHSPVDEGHHSPSDEAAISAPFRRDITFADEVKSPASVDSNHDELSPTRRSTEHHIAFLENQRNPKDTGTLYIPGPRDFDRGYRPHQVDETEDNGFSQFVSAAESPVATRSPSVRPVDAEESPQSITEHQVRKRFANKLSFEEAALAISRVGKGVVSKVKMPDHGLDGAKDAEKGESDDGEEPTTLDKRGKSRTFASFKSVLSHDREEVIPMPYLSYQPTIGRNSAFVNLNEQQREELGGIEYRALKTLAITLCVYYIGFHLLGMVCLAPWIVYNNTWGSKVTEIGVSRVWWGFFTPASLFNDLGYTLTPSSMIPFKYAIFPLLFGSWLIIIGNTGFPCWLRFTIWTTSKLVPKNSSLWEEFRFLLDHPRRCFTLLFPGKATWWLFWILVILNSVDLLFFIVLDLNDGVLKILPTGIRVLDGWFQAASTRTAGFAVVNLSLLHPACQVSYLIMMYISVFPIAISVRRTNVYEEKSLGIWMSDGEDDDSGNQNYVGAHLRRQLSFDLWYIFLGLFIICIVEGDRITNRNDVEFTIFSALFEIVSAYGTVGLSLGYPGTDTSFSAQFRVISKLVIIAMQIRGRHRGLPYALDKAILLPSEGQSRKENEDATRRHRSTQVLEGQDGAESSGEAPSLPRVGTMRSIRSNQSTKSRRRGGWKQLIGSALSAGPTAKRMKD